MRFAVSGPEGAGEPGKSGYIVGAAIEGRTMTYAVIVSSRTGNTARLADRARQALGEKNEVADVAAADLVLLGSWTDKGGLAEDLADALPQLAGKRVFLFGTCGFGGDPAYYDRVLDRFAAALPADALVVGRFMCQGQMPPTVRERYVKMAEQDPARFTPMIENFDRALGHPDEKDLDALVGALGAAGLLPEGGTDGARA